MEHAAARHRRRSPRRRRRPVLRRARAAEPLLRRRWLFVAYRRGEIHFEVGFQDGDGFRVRLRLRFEDGHLVGLVVVGEGEDVAFGQAGEVSEGVFEHGFRVGDVEEGGRLRLEFDEGARGEVGGADAEEVAWFYEERLHDLG